MKSINTRKFRTPYAILLALIIIAAIAGILQGVGLVHLFKHNGPPAISGGQQTKGEVGSSQKSSSSPASNSTSSTNSQVQPGDTKSDTSTNSSADLLVPTGDFVSNHHPNLSGSPAPNTLSSVCASTPGSSCTITFTKDGVSKSLPPQTTDRGGSAYWNWKLQDVGLTTGSWSVKATVSLGNQTKSADDAMQLVVQP